jgi:hypothetical protein
MAPPATSLLSNMKIILLFLALAISAAAQSADYFVVVFSSATTGANAMTMPIKNLGIPMGIAATSATTGTISVAMDSAIKTITPTGACTFNATGGTVGQEVSFFITTAGVSSFVLTWGTNFRKTGTLTTGTTAARFFTVTFRFDGTVWWEIARTPVQT